MNINYEEELEKAKQVAEALTCLAGFLDELGTRYEPLIIAVFRIAQGVKVYRATPEDDETLCLTDEVLVGGIHNAINELSGVIQDLQLEMEFGQ
jgi:hypothetical protein